MAILFEDENQALQKWDVDCTKDEVEEVTENDDMNLGDFAKDMPMGEDSVEMEISDDDLLDLGDDAIEYTDDSSDDEEEIVDEEFDPDNYKNLFLFSEESDSKDDEDENKKDEDSFKEDESEDEDDDDEDDTSDDDSKDEDSKEDDKKEDDSKSLDESFMFFEEDELVMDDDDIEGRNDISSDEAPSADDIEIDTTKDEVETVGESEDKDMDFEGMSVSENEDGTDGIPDPDYFEGEDGTANDDYKDDGVIDSIEKEDILEESFGIVFNEGIKLNVDNIHVINKEGKYFVTEDDLSMLSNYFDNRLSTDTLMKKISEHYSIPSKDLFVYAARNHILVEAKKAATMSNKATKESIKKRVKAIDNQVAMKKKAKKTTKKLDAEKKKLAKLAK